MHIKVFTKAKCFAMHMMTWQVLVFKTPEVLHHPPKKFANKERWVVVFLVEASGTKHNEP